MVIIKLYIYIISAKNLSQDCTVDLALKNKLKEFTLLKTNKQTKEAKCYRYKPVIPAHWRLRQEDPRLESILSYFRPSRVIQWLIHSNKQTSNNKTPSKEYGQIISIAISKTFDKGHYFSNKNSSKKKQKGTYSISSWVRQQCKAIVNISLHGEILKTGNKIRMPDLILNNVKCSCKQMRSDCT